MLQNYKEILKVTFRILGFAPGIVVGCYTLSGLVFMSELLRVCLVLKIVLMLHQFPILLNFSETPLHTWNILTAQRPFLFISTATLGITKSMKPWR
jgi:hypothetical protein